MEETRAQTCLNLERDPIYSSLSPSAPLGNILTTMNWRHQTADAFPLTRLPHNPHNLPNPTNKVFSKLLNANRRVREIEIEI